MAGSYLEQKLRLPGYTDDFPYRGAGRVGVEARTAWRSSRSGWPRRGGRGWSLTGGCARQAVRQKAAANAAVLDTRGQALHNRGLRRVEPFLIASRRQVTEAVKLLSGGADGSSKLPLVSAAATARSVFDEAR